MSTILVTRPKLEAKTTIAKLEAMGHRVISAPMIEIKRISFELPDEDRSLIISSRNGARLGLANVQNKDRPIFAVGEQTANEARKLGFTNITVGPGTARQLVPILLEAGITDKRKYSHLCGSIISYNVADALSAEGFDAENIITYQSNKVTSLSPEVQDALDAGEIDIALFYSPRTATTFEETTAEMGRSDWLTKMEAIGLSPRVAQELIGPWRSVRYAIIPTEKAILSLIGK